MNERRLLLGVCGGIAAYKAAALTSRLVQRGMTLDVVLTRNAQRFVTPLTFAALTHRRVYTSLWNDAAAVPHVRLARENAAIAIVPATADMLARLAHGIADDLLGNIVLAARIPLVVAPAMNTAMLEHPATVANLALLRARGVEIVEPESGFLAEREAGPGRLAGEDALVAAIERALQRTQQLAGERLLVTAGPTREAIDPVRFLSNASTGTMGIEVAREALARGARVALILGPTTVEPPAGAEVVRVTTAAQMYAAATERASQASIAIASAAVADWRPTVEYGEKVKKSDAPQALELERTPDILAALGAAKGGRFLVGFAAETSDLEANARRKLVAKNLDAIAVNDVSNGQGFGRGSNTLTLLYGSHGRTELGHASKAVLAGRLLDAIVALRDRAG